MIKYFIIKTALRYGKYVLVGILALFLALALLITTTVAMVIYLAGNVFGLNQAEGYCFPIDYPYRYTDIFGVYRENQNHAGIDLAIEEGSPAYAVYAGVIDTLNTNDVYGRFIKLRGKDGFLYLYGHLSKYATVTKYDKLGDPYEIELTEGMDVEAGQTIAYTGNTGRSTGPHLHFSVQKDGEWLNPYPFLIHMPKK